MNKNKFLTQLIKEAKMKNVNLTRLLVLISLIILIFACKGKSIDQLLEQGKTRAAERRCEKKNPRDKIKCYNSIAAFFLKKDQYKKAAGYYAKAGEHIKVINTYFQGNLIREAEKYCAAQTGDTKKQCAVRLGKKFFIKGNYNQAIRYYNTAGENENVLYIQAKIPIFQLVEQIDKKSKGMKDMEAGEKMKGIQKTLTAYIYMDKYHKWPYDRESNPYKRAADIYEKALKMLEDEVVPTVVKTLNSSSFAWSKQGVESLAFDHLKLESLIDLVRCLHHIAAKREFFSEYSVVFLEKSGKKENESHKSLNFEEAYQKALDHSQTLLETIEESKDVQNKEWLQDYKEDLTIDMQVIEYISSMIDNVKIRIEDVQRHSRKPGKTSEDKAVKGIPGQLFWDFVAQCNRVLHFIGKEEYQQANDLLISGYETAKTEIDRYSSRNKQ
ncbi:MAG: hypothetical protein JSV88_29375 [Candidatus Aminicenantes bacterium]|nr:MAG: hypothetical protein JSV88_29375 [Candidatus Aminicenantes bacterium]